MIIIFLLCLLGFVTVQATTTCDDANECKDQTISDSYVFCYGHYGCNGADITASSYVLCRGNYGCKDADITASSGSVGCYGNYGCYGADITAQNYDVNCYGNYGCYDSAITAKRNVLCYALYSCRDAQIKSATGIYAYGYYALYSARIDTDDQIAGTALTVNSKGYQSGYNADIICRSGRTCTLNCGNDGCQNLDFVCLSGSTCNVSPSGCTTSNGGATVGRVICPSYASSTSPFMDNDLLRKLEEKRLIKNKEKPDDFQEPQEPQEPNDYDGNNNRYYIPNQPKENDNNNNNKYYIKFDNPMILIFIFGLVLISIFLLICNIWNYLKGKKNRYDLVSYKSESDGMQ